MSDESWGCYTQVFVYSRVEVERFYFCECLSATFLLTICSGGGWQVPGWAAAASQLWGGVQGCWGPSCLAHAARIWPFILFHRYIRRWSHCTPCSVSEERLTSQSPAMWGRSHLERRGGRAPVVSKPLLAACGTTVSCCRQSFSTLSCLLLGASLEVVNDIPTCK